MSEIAPLKPRIVPEQVSLDGERTADPVRPCVEAGHRSNQTQLRACRLCSAFVCEACMVRDSYRKWNQPTFESRIRTLCTKCYARTRLSQWIDIPSSSDSDRIAASCHCTPNEAFLCHKCKNSQSATCKTMLKCFGEGCDEDLANNYGGRICTWCQKTICKSLADTRREYDVKHMNARLFATYERKVDPTPETYHWETLPIERPPILDVGDSSHIGLDCPCGEGLVDDSGDQTGQHFCAARPT